MSPQSPSKVETTSVPRHKPRRSLGRVLLRMLENFIVETNWKHIAFKICAYTYLSLVLWLAWHVCPFSSIWVVSRQTDGLAITHQDFANYFGNFEAYSDCGIQASDLYSQPPKDENGLWIRNAFCASRSQLLEAMSNGGRYGFDAPYTAKGCNYRWYTIEEICAILDRFDGLVFIGDSGLQTIYNGLNILLRQNLAYGSLKTWEMSDEETGRCKCDNQFIKDSCAKYFATSSDDVVRNVGGKHQNSYACQRTSHAFLELDKSGSSESAIKKFRSLVPSAPPSHYKPIPIIHSLTLPNDIGVATASLTDVIGLADHSKRNTPMLWIGPTAAGHIEVKGRKGNQDIWRFDRDMKEIANERDVEVLGMWNLTVQASSWDGLRFGERVSLVQAMMVINWLARLESS